MSQSETFSERRRALALMASGAVTLAGAAVIPLASAAKMPMIPGHSKGASTLEQLHARLRAIPRRRSFDTVPVVVVRPEDWDSAAASELVSYRYRSLQVWENDDVNGPWPGLMRESMNGQKFAHGNPEFLAVSATHGLAHLALFTQSMWDKYGLAGLTGGKFSSNTFLIEKPSVSLKDDIQDGDGFYGPSNSNIVSLQKRGAVFIACHDSIFAISRKLHADAKFNGQPVERIAADLTNHLIPDTVLVPSVVGFLVELQRAGFSYSKGG
jgi:hypothetical protein